MRHGCTLRWSVTAEPRESDPLQSAKQIVHCLRLATAQVVFDQNRGVRKPGNGTSKRVLSGTRLRAIFTGHNRR